MDLHIICIGALALKSLDCLLLHLLSHVISIWEQRR